MIRGLDCGFGFNLADGCLQDALIAVEFMSKQSAQLENLLEVEKIAHEIQQLADHLDFSHHNLDQATAAVMVADNASAAFVAAIVELGTAATQLEREATVQLHTLRAPMVQLADACREHGEGAKAMQAVQLAADERARQRGAAAGTSQNERPQVPGPVQVCLSMDFAYICILLFDPFLIASIMNYCGDGNT